MHRFINAVGAGQKRARALTREEATEAMALVAAGHAAPVQVGAFLLALRMKGETRDELAGFVDAFAPHVPAAPAPPDLLEVDAHGDGHAGTPSLLVAAAFAAAAVGVPVCLALERGSRHARHGLDGALASVGMAVGSDGSLDGANASRGLSRRGVAACDLAATCPPLHLLVALRPLLGLRTAAQTVAKLVSSFSPPARRRLVGVFHAPYLEPTAAALALLGVERGLVVQALGGLPEGRAGKILRVADERGPRTIDLRSLAFDAPQAPAAHAEAAAPAGAALASDEAGAAATRHALDGDEPFASAAAATAGLFVHAATGADAIAAARACLAALRDGRARSLADRRPA